MALIFSRLARNYIKNGYFPTDEATLQRIGNMLVPSLHGQCRLLDPCCGEGSAIADLRQMIIDHKTADHRCTSDTYGIEFDHERSRHAKSILDRVIQSDVHDVVVKARSMSLLFLNPPYGYGVSDKANQNVCADEHEKAERLERTFLRKTVPYLAYGGILIYIIPHYALDEEIRSFLVRNFKRLQVFMAPERQFKQIVIIGERIRPIHATKAALEPLVKAQASEDGAAVLPGTWEDAPYVVPGLPTDPDASFHAVRIDEEQLSDELRRYRHKLLWDGLESHFSQVQQKCRPPLRDLTPWHLALALAAGQVFGKIESDGGRTFLIKGDTYKRKERKVETEVDEKGNVSQTTVLLDKFVPVINALELTADHRLGNIVKIA